MFQIVTASCAYSS